MQTRAAARRATQTVAKTTRAGKLTSHATTDKPQPVKISQPNTLKRAAEGTLVPEPEAQGAPSRKRAKRAPAKRAPQAADELPHGLGRIHKAADGSSSSHVDSVNLVPEKGAYHEVNGRRNASGSDDLGTTTHVIVQKIVQDVIETALSALNQGLTVVVEEKRKTGKKRVPRKTKDNPYGLMPGRTPFPDWLGPSVEQCEEVHRLLTEMHGEFKSPDKIAPPSISVAGCGEVPDLVDALIRTLISGHTAMQNANLAIQDVIAKYGQWEKDSIGAGSIDWNKVRLSEEHEVIDAVKRAGLGPTKGKDIKIILEKVHEENQERRTSYLREKETGKTPGLRGVHELTQGQKKHQIQKVESGVLTLDHIRGMTSDEAMLELTKFPGIGVKTASCLILFCLQQPSFAVDTHVWRFCKWLKWAPPKASRDDTYMHGEVRVPDHLKYGLHQLFIRHGKECGRCRSSTMEGTAEWDSVVCPLEHLLDRFDKRKAKTQSKTAKKSILKKARETNVIQDEDEQVVDESEEVIVAAISENIIQGDEAGPTNTQDQRLEVQIPDKDLEGHEMVDDSELLGMSQTEDTGLTTFLTSHTSDTELSDLENDVFEFEGTKGKNSNVKDVESKTASESDLSELDSDMFESESEWEEGGT